MKPLIAHEDELAGKTIQSAQSTFEEVALHFTDGTAAVWHAELKYGEDIYLTLRDQKLSDYKLMNLGVISSEEYNTRLAENARHAEVAREMDERRLFQALLAKYGAEAVK